jgi:hypothetical protein
MEMVYLRCERIFFMDGNGFLPFLTASMEMVFIPFTMVVKL